MTGNEVYKLAPFVSDKGAVWLLETSNKLDHTLYVDDVDTVVKCQYLKIQ